MPYRSICSSYAWSLVLFVVMVAISLFATSDSLLAEEESMGANGAPTHDEAAERLSAHGTTNGDLAFPEVLEGVVYSTETNAALQASLQKYYAYRIQGYDYRMNVFKWQYYSSMGIYAVVLILVFSGIYFAAVQFHIGIRQDMAQLAASTGPPPTAPLPTELEISWKAVKVRSAVLGVIILTLSLAFFYLYVAFVYPIHDVF